MWTRELLKRNAKEIFKRNYWKWSLLSSGLAKISRWLRCPLWHDPDSNKIIANIE